LHRFISGIKTIAALSLVLKYPTLVSVSHSLVNAYKNPLAVSLATDYIFESSEKVSISPVDQCAHNIITIHKLNILSIFDASLAHFS
ncbi:hypothetical protein B0H19DRAFT_945587, partial [Mycena capillaripes]